MKKDIKKEIIKEFARIIEYKPSLDKGLDAISIQKQEIGMAIIGKLDQLLDKYRDDIVGEIDEKLRLRMLKEADIPLNERKNGWDILKEIRNLIQNLKSK